MPVGIAIDGANMGAPGSMVSEQPQNPHEEIPLEFAEFQKLYDSWVHGAITDQAVRAQFGTATLEMLEAQRIVVLDGPLDDGGSQQEGARSAAGRPVDSQPVASAGNPGGSGSTVVTGPSELPQTEHNLTTLRQSERNLPSAPLSSACTILTVANLNVEIGPFTSRRASPVHFIKECPMVPFLGRFGLPDIQLLVDRFLDPFVISTLFGLIYLLMRCQGPSHPWRFSSWCPAGGPGSRELDTLMGSPGLGDESPPCP